MVEAYWQIGRRIVEEEQDGAAKAAYGKGLLESLSKDLSADFGKGFTMANLRNFRQFYQTYPGDGIRYALRSELSWTHHRRIMREESTEARDYYLTECAKQGWSTRTLARQLKTQTYQRILSTKAQPATGSTALSILDFSQGSLRPRIPRPPGRSRRHRD